MTGSDAPAMRHWVRLLVGVFALFLPVDARSQTIPALPGNEFRPLDAELLKAAGLRTVEGRRMVLVTDLPARPDVDELPIVFDQAFGQWCDYCGPAEAHARAWRVRAFLMVDEAKFDAAGAMVPELPKFKHGFAIGNEVWVREQPTPYYRRHLLLHEGTHSYMQTIRGGLGPPWYAEGLAELLGTHRWEGGKLTLDWFPRSREEVPQLGRIKLVRDMVAAGRLMPLEQVLATPGTLNANNEPYAWCWALAALLDGTPAYRERFRKMPEAAASGQLEKRFRAAYADDWRELADQWEVFASTIEHGHDLERSAIRFAPGKPLAGSSTAVEVRVDLGWQSSGVELQAGRSYRLSASGRYQLGQKPQIWWCEPGGVTMRYHAGLPLGLVVGAIRPNEPTRGKPTPLAKPEPIGLGTTFTPHDTGTLYLRINDSPAELADNVGKVEVRVEAD